MSRCLAFFVLLLSSIPFGLHAQYVNGLKAVPSDIGDVRLTWYENAGNQPEGYIVYWKYFGSTDLIQPLDSFAYQFNDYNYQHTYSISPSNSTNRMDTVLFVIRAYKNHQPTPDVAASSVVIYHGQTLSSSSKDTAYANVPFTYKYYFWRETFVPASVQSILSLEQAPPGMHIDTANYRVQWTPTAPGDYSFVIKAQTSKDTAKYKVERLSGIIHVLAQDLAPLYIVISSTPSSTASVAQQYRYQSAATLGGTKASQYTPSFYYRIESLDGTQYPTGMTVSSGGLVQWTPSASGHFGYVLRLRLKKDTTIQATQSCVVDVGTSLPTLKLTAFPGTTAKRHQLYDEQLQAMFVGDSTGLHLRYALDYGPSGMTVNDTTGHIQWTPLRNGYYEYRVRAYVLEHPEVNAPFANQVNVNNVGYYCSFIVLTLKNQFDGYVGGECTAWKIDEGSDTNQIAFSTHSADGYFVIPVPSGKYKLQLRDHSFDERWYGGNGDANTAEVLTLPCNDTVNLLTTVAVRKADTLSVHGTVRDRGGKSVSQASVQFFAYGEATSLAPLWSSEVVQTDTAGAYSAMLDSRFHYVALVTKEQDGYRPLYSGATGNFCESERFNPDASTPLDFVMQAAAPAHHMTIHSNTSSSTFGSIASTTVFFDLDSAKDADPVVSAPARGDESHDIINMAATHYAMLCIPTEHRHVPMFAATPAATLDWRQSSYGYSDESIDGRCDIVLSKELLQTDGMAHLYGKVLGPTQQGSEPIAGALIYVLDDADNVVGYGFSMRDGHYDIRNLPSGHFRLSIMKVSVKPYEATVQFNMMDMASVQQDYVLEIPVSVNDAQLPFNSCALRAWPSPCSDILHVELPAQSTDAQLVLRDMMGRVVLLSTVAASVDAHPYELHLADLPTASYRLELHTDTVNLYRAIVHVRE